MKQDAKDAIWFAILCSSALVLTGLVTIPKVSTLTPELQNIIYAFGRLPILAICYIAFREFINDRK